MEGRHLHPVAALGPAADLLAAADPLGDRGRPPERRLDQGVQVAGLDPLVAGGAGVLDRPLELVLGPADVAAQVAVQPQQPPGARLALVVAEALQQREDLLDVGPVAVGAPVGRVQAQLQLAKGGVGGQPPVAGALGGGHDLVEDPLGPLGLDVEDQDLAQVGEQLQPGPVARREQGDGPLQQVGGGRQVAAAGGEVAGRGQLGRGGGRDLAAVGVHRAELGQEPVGPLQVPAEHLPDLAAAGRVRLGQPAGVALVQLGPGLLGQRVVGGVADELVAELEAVAAAEGGLGRAQQLLADQGQQVGVGRGPGRLGGEGEHGRPVEGLAHDRRAVQQGPLLAGQPVQAGGQQRLDGRRGGGGGQVVGHPAAAVAAQPALLDQHGQQLLEEQRVALGGPGDAVGGVAGQGRLPGQVLQQGRRLLGGQRLQQHGAGVQAPARPAGPLLQQLGPGHGHHQDAAPPWPGRRPARPGRAGPAGPSGGRRSPPPAGAARPAPPGTAAPPRRRPRRSPGPAAARSAAPAGRSPARRLGSSSSASSLASACSGESAVLISAARRTISATGQKLLPSAPEEHWPYSTVAASSMASTAAATSRDLPTPAGPSTVSRWQVEVLTVRWNIQSNSCSSASRPTSGLSERRACPRASGDTSTSRQAVHRRSRPPRPRPGRRGTGARSGGRAGPPRARRPPGAGWPG